MVCTRSRAAVAQAPPAPAPPKPEANNVDLSSPEPNSTPSANHEAYERFRNERIRANIEKMQKLGIIDLGLKIKTQKRGRPIKRVFKSPQSGMKSAQLPSRRSSRLQGLPSVCYFERGAMAVLESAVVDGEVKKVRGEWNMDAAGQAMRGRRIYDKINGKTCHQCRQKTLRRHTRCSKCEGVKGQFCGGCLRARYGEQIFEALENPNWVCPVCRGICNCSFCRLKNGLAPTGQIYYKVANLGFTSVAHYLTQTKMSRPGKLVADETNSMSVKRSITFAEN